MSRWKAGAVWVGDPERFPVGALATVDAVSPSGKTLAVTLGDHEYIWWKNEVITVRQARNRSLTLQEPSGGHQTSPTRERLRLAASDLRKA